MKKFVIANSKGGVGKTTTSVNLASALASAGNKVLLVDLDVQDNVAIMLGLECEYSILDVVTGDKTALEAAVQVPETKTNKGNLFVIGGGHGINLLDTHIRQEMLAPADIVKNAVNKIEGFDYLIIDTNPKYDYITMNGVMAGENIIAPVLLQDIAIKSFVQFVDKIKAATSHNPAVNIKMIVPTAYDQRYADQKQSLKSFKKAFGDVVSHPIRTDGQLTRMSTHNASIFDYDHLSKGAKDYSKLAKLVMA